MDTLQGLTQLNQVPVDMTLEGMAALRQRQQTDAIGLQELARKQQHEQQMDPLRIRQQQLANDVSLQNLGKTTRDNREADFTSNARMQDELKKHLLGADASDLAQIEQHGQRLAYSTNPKERATGQQILLQTKAAIQEREKIRLQGQNAERLMGIQVNAGRFTKAAPVDRNTLLIKLRSSKSALQTAEILDQAHSEAVAAGDTAGAQELAVRAMQARQRAAEDARNRGLATPGIDIGATGGLAMNPPPQAQAPIAGSTGPQAPQQGPLKLTPKHEDWITRAMAANPGATRAQIIEQGTTLGKFK